MADFTQGRETLTQGVVIDRVFVAGQEAEFIFGRGTQIYPNAPVQLYGTTSVRIVDEGEKKWFEVGFRIDAELTGNSGPGWTDAGNYLKIEVQWSDDLQTWRMGKFAPAAVPVVDLGGGIWEYWSRALNPVDAEAKIGAISFGNVRGDNRINGFTSMVIASIAQPLAHFPYDMTVSGTAAQLQADLVALGWIGSVVTGTAASDWRVTIPNVPYESYADQSWIGFPSFTVPDFIVGTIVVDRTYPSGSFVDDNGVEIPPKGFARLRISAGTRYDPYL